MLAEGIQALLGTRGPYCYDYFVTGDEGKDYLEGRQVLVLGAGGLGCELLKCLAMSGIKHIHVVDMDTIDVSNLNRQFLFRQKDVGRYKSEVAAEFIKRRVPDCEITSHTCKIQEFPDDFFLQFDVIIGGLDNVNARLYMNDKVVQIAKEGGPVIPYIDGGSEKWMGHCKFIKPLETACLSCYPSIMKTKPQQFQFCTIATNPRQPEHCVAWVKDILWPKEHPGEKLDGDNDDHIAYVVEKANEHGKKYNLGEITPRMARGVIKNIIPAIASTQAFVASMCTTEAIKYITGCAPNSNNQQVVGDNGIAYANTVMQKNSKCEKCSDEFTIEYKAEDKTLQQLIDDLENVYKLTAPKISNGAEKIYYPNLIPETKLNLPKKLVELAAIGDELIVACSGSQNFYTVILG
ncbi:hypothetical protein TVAG_161040 [Trichomonas vaginalis G3]|uniref:NEDD8-activating enzyme E1 catalytic subunit n=1 Tax=Trichomonas vaginalis (strain ATCC PRA-98 / G3) TaxID=412133 RepID=A2E4V9_TRIV3|nr:NEDD8 activating enzyme protein [Trichomonas vaginalis G3]EAY12298.1 hypothetical protein TVAG_161040 [Trichomonas vaginalis G3]KAI5552412.1 NEDD8 activating enzyme protein [Trichomonas vaginalis G3]|eukprot:XP_001324521.1 hypothetical protein [Trichomonas vaginalis G3]